MKLLPGSLALALIFGVIVAAFAGILVAAGPEPADLPWRYVGSVVRFTVLQASLSTLLSILLGAALALALARRAQFAGRDLFIAALNLASVLPQIVVAFGIVAVAGRAGWLGASARLVGLDPGGWLYGLPGILIAHVFFNAPLAARVFLVSLASIPSEHWRLASQLGMPPAAVFRLVDLPVLKREAPALAALIFLLCFTSFAVVLMLGGGPRAATLEVAIYESVRFDVDFARAGLLALLQVAICLAFALPVLWLARRSGESAATGVPFGRPDVASPAIRALDAAAMALAALLVLPPLLAIGSAGISGIASLARSDAGQAVTTSFAIAIPAAILSLALALGLAASARRLASSGRATKAAAMTMPASLILAVPPVALSAGLFVVLRPVADPFALAIPLIILVNALMALPFALRQVEPPLTLSAERYGRLADSLGISGVWRLKLVDWPLLRRPLLAALAIATALSLGDLGVAAFFGSGNILTLPLLLYQRMGSYRIAESASVALLLALLVLALFLAAQKWSEDPLARSR
ncbi:MAG: thiamine/thiamine pyrophosphate ABC transporter permease ThiP [Propylenella sp.]